ncbi:MAG TPA: tRNA (N6-isopentenyl adenosine(37)-C2)-methylthiotransferase MiaB [Candidatus Methylacidiphilales bacterium]|jgi:tRNA-2-methylthio-N6-dimethylallyladenosine synthase|nr:tRNA (N6-isopentenyl adenosine(37)-C2)-methylthiotransferase MiaB [Candidatus Methylacidiphilales bacterium]
MPSVFIKTYGCQMNVRDSEQVARDLAGRGYDLVDHEEGADVVLLNTCSVRDMAEQKAIGKMQVLEGRKKRRRHQVIGFLGCMAQSRGASILDDLPEVDLVIGTQKFHETGRHVDDLFRQRRENPGAAPERIVDVAEETGSQNTIRDHLLAPNQVTAFVSIMQGCNMHCTFCIVPSTRGAERSRPIGEIVAEVEALVRQGVREVTLLGQIVNLYGRHEFPAVEGLSPFAQLLRAVCAVPGLQRVRFTSPHPIGFKDDLVACFRDLPLLCEHVHLPLQSGSDRILKAMHRAYTRAGYLRLIEKLRAAQPRIAFTTDVIVGFPGETEDDFRQTCELVREVGFDNAFIFRYSPRRDTPAATMEGQLPEVVKMERNQILLRILDEIAARRMNDLLGREDEILVEGESRTNPARFQGRTRTNRLVLIDANERWRGQLLPVRLTESTGFTWYAEPVLR